MHCCHNLSLHTKYSAYVHLHLHIQPYNGIFIFTFTITLRTKLVSHGASETDNLSIGG